MNDLVKTLLFVAAACVVALAAFFLRPAPFEQPRQRQLGGGGAVFGGDALQRAVGGSQRSGGQREPRDEGDAVGLARLEDGFGRPDGHVVHVLHGHDRCDRPCRGELLDRYLGQADVTDLASLQSLPGRGDIHTNLLTVNLLTIN